MEYIIPDSPPETPLPVLRRTRPRLGHLLPLAALAWVSVISPDARAQFGKTFASPDVVSPTLNAVHQRVGGPITVILETDPANDDAYWVIDGTTGALRTGFRLDRRHGALDSPDGQEIRVAGAQQTADLQPVLFAGKYDATTLQAIAEMQLGIDKNSGYNLTGEVTPDGRFLYRGSLSPLEVNVIGKYDDAFSAQWGATLTFRGQFQPLGVEAYPLAGGPVGFLVEFPEPTATGVLRNHVLGALHGETGAPLWSAVVETRQTPTAIDDFRFVFGDDGSFFALRKTVDLVQPAEDAASTARVRADGTLAYAKRISFPGAVLRGQYFLGEDTLFYLTFREAGADRLQFSVLDENGQPGATVALKCELRGSGSDRITAARRIGTKVVFLRFEAAVPGQSPQQTLARWNLESGAIDLRRLPTTLLTGSRFDVITTPAGDFNSPFDNAAGIPARATALTSILTNPLGGPGTLAIYELPRNGDFPACFDLTPSPIVLGTPIPPSLSDAPLVDLSRGATVVPHTMPGMVPALLRPTLTALNFTETSVCPDDPETAVPTLAVLRQGTDRLEIRIPTEAGHRYRLEESDDLTHWQELQSRDGSGTPWLADIPFDANRGFFRVRVDPTTP